MDIDSDDDGSPTGGRDAMASQYKEPWEGRGTDPQFCGPRLTTRERGLDTKKTNERLLRLLGNILKFVRDKAIAFFDANMENSFRRLDSHPRVRPLSQCSKEKNFSFAYTLVGL